MNSPEDSQATAKLVMLTDAAFVAEIDKTEKDTYEHLYKALKSNDSSLGSGVETSAVTSSLTVHLKVNTTSRMPTRQSRKSPTPGWRMQTRILPRSIIGIREFRLPLLVTGGRDLGRVDRGYAGETGYSR
jgi:hypothetical protein